MMRHAKILFSILYSILFLAAIGLGAAAPAQAEVKKFMLVCDGKLCPYYEVALNPPDGWMLEATASKQNRLQMIVPKGKNFGNAEALIYIKVSHKDKDTTMDKFIAVSQERWKQSVPDTRIAKLADVARDGNKPAFQSYRYENPSQKQQSFEVVSFGIDTDADGNEFNLMVVMTGRSKKALEQAQKSYQALLRAH